MARRRSSRLYPNPVFVSAGGEVMTQVRFPELIPTAALSLARTAGPHAGHGRVGADPPAGVMLPYGLARPCDSFIFEQVERAGRVETRVRDATVEN